MIKTFKKNEFGQANYGWLDTHYHFSFANYYNPDRMGFGVLRVVNDDVISAGFGFDTHPHRDMEIITYVRKGAITHKDSMGNKGRTEAGDVQVMSAGSGVRHSEFNHESEHTVLYQIWIEPKELGIAPSWDQRAFPKEATDSELILLVSGNEADDALKINQDAEIYGGNLTVNSLIKHDIKRQAYVLISEGKVELDGQLLEKGDAAEIVGQDTVSIYALTDAELLIIDLPQ